jgi:hypothetical protein
VTAVQYFRETAFLRALPLALPLGLAGCRVWRAFFRLGGTALVVCPPVSLCLRLQLQYSKELSVRNRTLSGSQPVSKKLRHQPASF